MFIREGEMLGLVGESGCGKTTAGRAILRLIAPTERKIRFRSKQLAGKGEEYKDVDVATASLDQLKRLRRELAAGCTEFFR